MYSDNQAIIYSEAVFCDRCYKLFAIASICSHLKAHSFEEFDRFIHKKLTNKNPYLNKISNIIDTFIIDYDKKYDFYLIKYDFNLVFNNYENLPHLYSSLSNSKIMFCLKSVLKDVINEYNNKGYTFNRKVELNVITKAHKRDMTYDFYIKHNMCALEWKLNAMINKNKNLINKLDRSKCHPLIRKFLMSHSLLNYCMC